MSTPFYLINAFTNTRFNCKGNPCAVLHLKNKLDANQMQKIAFELNFPATSFLYKTNDHEYEVRWFAPDAEIGLCGHGAYASLVSIYSLNSSLDHLSLYTKHAEVIVSEQINNCISMRLKSIWHEKETTAPIELSKALDCNIISYHTTNNKHIVVTDNQTSVEKMKPDFEALRKIEVFGYSITAIADEPSIDFVSRTIIPHVQQLEDHATGSSHAALFPYWKDRFHKSELTALQLSSRGGYFSGKLDGDYVYMKSEAEIIFTGILEI